MITLGILRWRYYLGLAGWAQCNHKSTFGREAGGSELVVGDVIMKHEVGVMLEGVMRQGLQAASRN